MQEVALRNWGNSQGIRIPSNVLKKLDIHTNDIIELYVENDTIVLRKRFQHRSFEERLKEYDNKISVTDFDWGEPVGKELI